MLDADMVNYGANVVIKIIFKITIAYKLIKNKNKKINF